MTLRLTYLYDPMNKIRRINTKVISSCIFFMGVLITTNAQDTPTDHGTLVTDRPDATEAPSVVPGGYLQVETGGFYESFEGSTFKTERYVYNTALLRYGLLKNVELRVGWNIEEQTAKINNTTLQNTLQGFSPLLFGVKVVIAEEKGAMPEMGLIGHLFLPFTASQDFKPETTGKDFRFAFSHTLSEKSNLSYNLGAQWGDDSPEAAYIYTVAYGYAITGNFGAYAELYGDLPENSNANHLWDVGVTYLLKPSIQLDATIGTSITEGQDILLSAGISFRIPN